MKMDSTSIVSRNKGIVTRAESNGKYLIYNPETDEIHLLQPLAYQILNLCETPHSVASLLSKTTEQTPALQCEKGQEAIMGLLEKLTERRLLTVSE